MSPLFILNYGTWACVHFFGRNGSPESTRTHIPLFLYESSWMNARLAPTLATCSARFSSEDGEDVDTFVTEVSHYMRATQVSKDAAHNDLACCWKGALCHGGRQPRTPTPTWSDATRHYRRRLGRCRRITRHQGGEKTKFFFQWIVKVFDQLSFATCPKMRVATVYGLLDGKIRQRILLKAAVTTEAVVELANDVEATIREDASPRKPKATRSGPPPFWTPPATILYATRCKDAEGEEGNNFDTYCHNLFSSIWAIQKLKTLYTNIQYIVHIYLF